MVKDNRISFQLPKRERKIARKFFFSFFFRPKNHSSSRSLNSIIDWIFASQKIFQKSITILEVTRRKKTNEIKRKKERGERGERRERTVTPKMSKPSSWSVASSSLRVHNFVLSWLCQQPARYWSAEPTRTTWRLQLRATSCETATPRT